MEFIANNKLFPKKMVIWFLLAIFFIILDRFFKIISLKHFNYILINDWLKFSLAKNYFIAFSLPVSGIFLNYLIFLIILALIGYILIKKGLQNSAKMAFLFIILGASSNLFDRLKYGFVIDYINLRWFTVFNIADIIIVCSIFFLLFLEFKQK